MTVLVFLVGIAAMTAGSIMVFSAGMASAPTPESINHERIGIAVFFIGVAMFLGSIIYAVYGCVT